MTDIILVINAGSSSVKFAAFSELSQALPTRLAHGAIDGIGDRPRLRVWGHDGNVIEDRAVSLSVEPDCVHDDALKNLFDWLAGHAGGRRLLAVGHRVVHGGASFDKPVRITPQVMTELDQLVMLAPLHQPHNLAAIRAVSRQRPDVPQVACFDTAFHSAHTWVAQALALPHRIPAGRQALRFSRPVLRIHCQCAARSSGPTGGQPGGGCPSGQRRQHVRHARAQEH